MTESDEDRTERDAALTRDGAGHDLRLTVVPLQILPRPLLQRRPRPNRVLLKTQQGIRVKMQRSEHIVCKRLCLTRTMGIPRPKTWLCTCSGLMPLMESRGRSQWSTSLHHQQHRSKAFNAEELWKYKL